MRKASTCIQHQASTNCQQHPVQTHHSNNKQDRNTNSVIRRQDSHHTPKHTASHSPAHQKERSSPPPTRMQAQVPLNMKPTQVTRRPTSPAGGRDQKQELQPYSLVKGDLKHSKLDKRKYQRTIVQTKEQGKTHKTKYTKRK